MCHDKCVWICFHVCGFPQQPWSIVNTASCQTAAQKSISHLSSEQTYGLKIKHPALSLSPWVYLDRPPFKLPSPLNPIMNIKAGHKANCQLERSLKLSLTPHNNDIHLKLWQKTNNGINAGCLGILFNRRIARGKITGTSQWTAIFLLLSCTNTLEGSTNIKAGRGKTSWTLWTEYTNMFYQSTLMPVRQWAKNSASW